MALFIEVTGVSGEIVCINVDNIGHFRPAQPYGTVIYLRNDFSYVVQETPTSIIRMVYLANKKGNVLTSMLHVKEWLQEKER